VKLQGSTSNAQKYRKQSASGGEFLPEQPRYAQMKSLFLQLFLYFFYWEKLCLKSLFDDCHDNQIQVQHKKINTPLAKKIVFGSATQTDVGVPVEHNPQADIIP
jgi:hypothetical protein